MSTDPIVDEVRRAREDYAKKFDFDLDAIVSDVQRRQTTSVNRLVRLRPRPAETSVAVPTEKGLAGSDSGNVPSDRC